MFKVGTQQLAKNQGGQKRMEVKQGMRWLKGWERKGERHKEGGIYRSRGDESLQPRL